MNFHSGSGQGQGQGKVIQNTTEENYTQFDDQQDLGKERKKEGLLRSSEAGQLRALSLDRKDAGGGKVNITTLQRESETAERNP